MAQLTQNPPEGIVLQLICCIEWIYQLRGRLGTGSGGGGSSITLQTNSVNNSSQTILNLVDGSNTTVTDNGGGSVSMIAALTQNQIAYGSPTNEVTSSGNLQYQATIGRFLVNDVSNKAILDVDGFNGDYGIGDLASHNKHTYIKLADNNNIVWINGNNGGATAIPTAPSVNFSGSGLNDMTNTTVTFTGTALITYTITINSTGSPDTYNWTDGTTTVNNIDINSGASTPLSHGVEITFANKSGHTIGDVWSFSYTVAYGKMLSLDGQGYNYILGDVDGVNNNTNLSIADASQIILIKSGGNRLGEFSLNVGKVLCAIGDIDASANNTVMQVDDNLRRIIHSWGAGQVNIDGTGLTTIRQRVEPDKDGTYAMTTDLSGTITTPAYGTTVDLSAVTMVTGEIRDVEFNSSTGATGLLLPIGTNAAIGAIVIVGDLLAISLTSNIVVDAGTSNTINAATIAQTQTMNVSGSCWTLKKVTAGKWKLQ